MEKVDIIKYEGDNSTFVWKHPAEDFFTGTQLIVHESQEALFFMNGQALDLFGPGCHTLESQNLPLLSRAMNRAFDDQTPFHCEVYFINKTEQMAIRWGTDSRVEYVEPTYHFPLQIGANGEMSLRVENARKIMIKLVGTEEGITQESLIRRFRGILLTRVKTYLARVIREKKIDIFAVDEHLTEMSEALHERLMPDFRDYGLVLERFVVTTVVKPEEDEMYRRFKELHFRQYADIAEAQLRQQVDLIEQQTKAQQLVIEAQSIAQKRVLEGYSYREERSFDVAQSIAENEAIGELNNLGIGLGVMGGVGGAVSKMVGQSLDNAIPMQGSADEPSGECPVCHTMVPKGARFCFGCGTQIGSLQVGGSRCPSCGATTLGGKFCMHCGIPLVQKCPQCGQTQPYGAKFCMNCGCQM